MFYLCRLEIRKIDTGNKHTTGEEITQRTNYKNY